MSRRSLPDTEAVQELLSSRQRRLLLSILVESQDDLVSRGTLARRIAAWEREKSPDVVTEAEQHRAAVKLHHDHLPRLEAYNVVEYDPRQGDVVERDGLQRIEPELAEECEKRGSPTVARAPDRR